ncbi:hypothetical protein Pla52o_56020 [Novipirellula galeiformis]|uniref:Uncharacterized protein n=1 Tax=Novipirellula galeiformis TaxID=2528004 RepID=A0A5C6BL29_9BACT|nr:hypothetical protein Pla52o_56020 [Novipirellula galeiformis]
MFSVADPFLVFSMKIKAKAGRLTGDSGGLPSPYGDCPPGGGAGGGHVE